MSTWPDVEGGIRDWLRDDAGITALVGQRVFFGVPLDAREASFPLVTVQRVGGGQDASEAPVDLAVIDVSVWAQLRDKAGATALLNAVRSRLEELRTRTTVTAGVDLFGAEVIGVVWLPDPDNARPRYSVTAEVTAMAA